MISTKSPTLRLSLAAIALSALFVLPACYTLFKHPRLASLNYARPDEAPCTTCHTGADLSRYVRQNNAMQPSGAWAEYYADPRWLEKPTTDSTAVDSEPPPEKARK